MSACAAGEWVAASSGLGKEKDLLNRVRTPGGLHLRIFQSRVTDTLTEP